MNKSLNIYIIFTYEIAPNETNPVWYCIGSVHLFGLHVMECSPLRSARATPAPKMMLETRLHLATAQTKGREQIFFGGTGENWKMNPRMVGMTFLYFSYICILLGDANLRNRGGLCLAIRQELQEPWIGIFWRLPVRVLRHAPLFKMNHLQVRRGSKLAHRWSCNFHQFSSFLVSNHSSMAISSY